MGDTPSKKQYFYKNVPVNLMNHILVGIYEYTKHYFKYVDRDEFFKELSNSAALLKVNNVNYKIPYHGFKDYHFFKYAYSTIEHKLNEEIEKGGDILAGLYFPNNKVGDEIDIMINDIVISTIKITDINKIYLPLDDLYFIILMHTQGPIRLSIKCKQTQNLTYHVVFLLLDMCTRRTLCLQCSNYKIELKKQTLYFAKCTVYPKNSNNVCLPLADYPQMLAAMQIQKIWNKYKNRKNVDWIKWNHNIEFVNDDIKYMPDIGIEYFNSLNSYTTNKLF